jgi:IS30 family transposase
MEQQVQQAKKCKYLTLEERRKFQALYESGMPAYRIAEQLGINCSTAYRELKRGRTAELDEYGLPKYDAETAQRRFKAALLRRPKRSPIPKKKPRKESLPRRPYTKRGT